MAIYHEVGEKFPMGIAKSAEGITYRAYGTVIEHYDNFEIILKTTESEGRTRERGYVIYGLSGGFKSLYEARQRIDAYWATIPPERKITLPEEPEEPSARAPNGDEESPQFNPLVILLIIFLFVGLIMGMRD